MRLAKVEIRRDGKTRLYTRPIFYKWSEDVHENEIRVPMPEIGLFLYDPAAIHEVTAAAQLITSMQHRLAAKISDMQLDIQRLETLRIGLLREDD
jgi:hypothetical protein